MFVCFIFKDSLSPDKLFVGAVGVNLLDGKFGQVYITERPTMKHNISDKAPEY